MKRTREYRRSVAETHIAKRKYISKHIYFFDWYHNDNQYSKNKVFCSCPMCRWCNAHSEVMKYREANELAKYDSEDIGIDLDVRIPRRIRKYF